MMQACLILTMLLSLVGCGKTEEQDSSASGYVYVPTFMDINIPEANWINDVQIAGDEMYVSYTVYDEVTYESETKLMKKNLSDGSEFAEIPLQMTASTEGNQLSLNSFCVGKDGSLYFVAYEYPQYDPENPDSYNGDWEPVYFILKYDKDGNQVAVSNISEVLLKDEMNNYVNNMLIDEIEEAGGVDLEKPFIFGYTGLDNSAVDKFVQTSMSLYEGYSGALRTPFV